MSLVTSLFIVGFIIIVGLISQYIFKKFKIPDVLILMVFGALLSYFNLANTIKQGSTELTFLITFSLIYVVFYGALPIKLKAIFSTMKYALLSSLLNFIVITALLGSISYLFGFGWLLGLSLGALFCVLDGSIINSLLGILKISPKAEAQIQTESAIIDVLVIVGVLSFINFARIGLNQVLQNLTSYLFLSFAIGLVVAFVWSFTLKHVGNYSSAPVATMAVLVMLYAFGEYVGANGVITVFCFSIILGNVALLSKLFYKRQKESLSVMDMATKSFFKEISFLIRTFLFVYLGLLVDFTMWPYLLLGLMFFVIAYLLRSFISKHVYNESLTHRELYFIDAMCAKGLTPTVMLAVIGGTAAFTNTVVGGIFSSVLITSILIFLVERGKFTTVSNMIVERIKHSRHKRRYG
ncbi:MAG: cation:proton antiporter [Nanoarchaeota archaeon]|nr:cation:proton antiporter [Nanoarchaeota archaeon]